MTLICIHTNSTADQYIINTHTHTRAHIIAHIIVRRMAKPLDV
jgi:hypothetical protein